MCVAVWQKQETENHTIDSPQRRRPSQTKLLGTHHRRASLFFGFAGFFRLPFVCSCGGGCDAHRPARIRFTEVLLLILIPPPPHLPLGRNGLCQWVERAALVHFVVARWGSPEGEGHVHPVEYEHDQAKLVGHLPAGILDDQDDGRHHTKQDE